ncbi:uncharacterized protein LOC130211119 isoform X1 [Pseudoliparis swirei]|uniref:uncharacterized protein LOC130211119 isoform X1 n=1 Tax=Pseudoliparis swirei TaxID=2059687 RepID=UPI0024BDB49D|nr:uncharacterized protein LOC130211119 isoform X1 [Pseudoliparis swirei]XP_056297723.1 uncharacterized protein LOC130211119 isoform X1 [Pseudoliparis swirei]
MANPIIRIVNPDAPGHRQQAVIIATKEAWDYREKRKVFPKPPQELLHPTSALAHAEKLLRAEGVPAPSRQLCLGELVVPFSQYGNAPFHWLVANDVGYMKYMLDKHRLETTNPQTKGKVGNQWVKDFLTEDAESFPQVSSLLEAHIDRCIYGQRGFEHHTCQEMWELYSQYLAQEDRPEQVSAEQRELTQKAHSSVRRWLHTPVTHITSVQMKRFRRFIKEKDQERVSTRCDVSSWPNDEAELVAASQAVEGWTSWSRVRLRTNRGCPTNERKSTGMCRCSGRPRHSPSIATRTHVATLLGSISLK